MKIAFVGDVHGRIKLMYDLIELYKVRTKDTIAHIIQVGDMQALRYESDLNFLSVPERYRTVGDFPKYFQNGAVPVNTLFIGGNHENFRWLKDYPRGHELVKNFRFIGRSNILEIGNLTIAGISGNYSEASFNNKKKKDKHFTKEDIDYILNSRKRINVLVTHEWPRIKRFSEGIIKTSLTDEAVLKNAISRDIGSDTITDVIMKTRPNYVFSGHYHVPLDFEVKIKNDIIRFIGLGKLEKLVNSVFILDSESIKGDYYNLTYEAIFGLFKEPEMSALLLGFKYLEEDNIVKAQNIFDNLLGYNSTDYAKALVYYGMGVIESKQVLISDSNPLEKAYKALDYFKRARHICSFADLHLMTGYLNRFIIDYRFSTEKSTNEKDQELIDLCSIAIDEYSKASLLNSGFLKESKETIQQLELDKQGLKLRIDKRHLN